MCKVLLATILSAFVCMTASQLFSIEGATEPKPPIPPLADSCFNKTFWQLFQCQATAGQRWQNDTDQRQAFCCATWDQLDCSFPYIQVRITINCIELTVWPTLKANLKFERKSCRRLVFDAMGGVCRRLCQVWSESGRQSTLQQSTWHCLNANNFNDILNKVMI